MLFISRNIDNVSQLKMSPDIMLSTGLENYINKLTDVHSVHPDSLSIVLLNCVATN